MEVINKVPQVHAPKPITKDGQYEQFTSEMILQNMGETTVRFNDHFTIKPSGNIKIGNLLCMPNKHEFYISFTGAGTNRLEILLQTLVDPINCP